MQSKHRGMSDSDSGASAESGPPPVCVENCNFIHWREVPRGIQFWL